MIKIPLKAGHHRAASWRPDEGLTLNSGQVALRFFSGSGPVLLRRDCDLPGLVRTPCPPPLPLWIRPCQSRNFQSGPDVSLVEPVLNKV